MSAFVARRLRSAVAPPSERKCVPSSLLDNGEGTAKSQCGRPTVPLRHARSSSLSQCIGKRTTIIFPFLVPVGHRGPSSVTGSSDQRLGFARVEISMESLILAQDERWRRA